MTDQELSIRLTEMQARTLAAEERLEKMERRQDDLNRLMTTVEVLALREQSVERDVKEIKSDVKRLSEKPAKRWEGLMDKALFAAAGALLTWLAAGMPSG